MANNPNLFNAIICGLTGGAQQRWLTDTESQNYADFQGAVLAIATQIDGSLAPIAGGGSAGQSALMQSICAGVFSNRYVQDVISDNFSAVGASILALFTEMGNILEPAAAPGTFLPLSHAFYVDANTSVPEGEQTGFIGTPFASVAAASDASQAGDTLIICPGTPNGFVGTEHELSIVGLSRNNCALENITCDADLYLANLTVQQITAHVALNADNCTFQQTLDGAATPVILTNCIANSSVVAEILIATDCFFNDILTIGDSAVINGCKGTGINLTADSLNAENSNLSNSLAVNTLIARNSNLGGAIEAVSGELLQCQNDSNSTFTGTLVTRDTTFGILTAAILQAANSEIQGQLTLTSGAGGSLLENCVIGAGIDAVGPISIFQSRVGEGIIVTAGSCTTDHFTENVILTAGHTIAASGGIIYIDDEVLPP